MRSISSIVYTFAFASLSLVAGFLVPTTHRLGSVVNKLATKSPDVDTSTPAYEDPSGLFRHGSSGYVPAGLTEKEYASLRQKEADHHAQMNYAAWGPRFRPSDGPVADDMAWMVMPELWTGTTTLDHNDETDDTDDPLPLGPDFLQHAKPWSHAGGSAAWGETYRRFSEGTSVHQMVADLAGKTNDDGLLAAKTCEVVGHILQGVAHHGGCVDGSEDAERLDLDRLAIHVAPHRSDWDAMQKAELLLETDITSAPDSNDDETGETMLCGAVSQSDFLRTILKVRFDTQAEKDDDDDDPLKEFSEEDIADMQLCLDWYITLRRIGISSPFDDAPSKE
ncbi:expressed unknown protein [Seminavis robusta]|uniref:Uncharacterized protein n=1 Tax=Seminavis robusta TaxID=568900 RepID=A0A9N8DQU4_9STRA|nr:expressed unknown protein [Seminavis robusta]|eukprot:Sro289_g109180.1 n/a (336) ;mRNA; f:63796-64803